MQAPFANDQEGCVDNNQIRANASKIDSNTNPNPNNIERRFNEL